MVLIAELHLHGDVILFEETFERAPDAECTFEDVHYVTREENETHYVFFWWVQGTDFGRFETGLDADPTARGWGLVTDLDEKRLYRIRTRSFPDDQPLVFPEFRDHDVTAIESRRNAEGLHLKARFPTRDALESFVESARDIANHVDTKRLYTDSRTTIGAAELTEKQAEALTRALERGYFDSPSRVTLAELADCSDVTPQTLSDHIRSGVKKVVRNAVRAESGE